MTTPEPLSIVRTDPFRTDPFTFTDEHLAERLVQDWMNTTGWTEAQLAARAKGDAEKATLAARLRRETPMTRAWIAQRLTMGSASYVSHLTNGNRRNDHP